MRQPATLCYTHAKVHLMCFYVYNTYCICSKAHCLTNIHRTFHPLHPNQFFSCSGKNCIDSIYVTTHQEWHSWRGGSSVPSVALSNSYPWHHKDSLWVVRWLGVQSQSTLQSIDRTEKEVKLPPLDHNGNTSPYSSFRDLGTVWIESNVSTLPPSISSRKLWKMLLLKS